MHGARGGMTRYAAQAGFTLAMSAISDTDARIRAEEKVAIILEENAETLALLAIMLKRRGMDQATAEMTLRKVGWWRI